MYGAFRGSRWPASAQIDLPEAEYNETYLPPVHQVPKMENFAFLGVEECTYESIVYRIGVLWFSDEYRLQEASTPEEWTAMFACCDSLIERYLVSMRIA